LDTSSPKKINNNNEMMWLVLFPRIYWVRSRDVCKSRIHDRRDYRDFRLVPWFPAIAVILCHGRDYHQNMYNLDFERSILYKYL